MACATRCQARWAPPVGHPRSVLRAGILAPLSLAPRIILLSPRASTGVGWRADGLAIAGRSFGVCCGHGAARRLWSSLWRRAARAATPSSRAILWRLLQTRRGAQVVLLPLAAPREQPLPALATASCSSMMLISSTRSSTFLTEAPSRRPPQPQWQATARTWPRPWARGASRAPSSGRGGPCAGPSGRSRCARRSGGRSR